MVCFSAGNLIYVAGKFTGRHYVFADNDASRTGERSAWKTGLPYAMAPTTGQDANDLHMAAGVMAVAKNNGGAQQIEIDGRSLSGDGWC